MNTTTLDEGATGSPENAILDSEKSPLTLAELHAQFALTDFADGPNRFEVNGASAARAFVRDHGFDDRRAQLVWDSIALHTTASIGAFKEAEVALCGRGISVDFGAPDYAAFQKADIDAIVAAVPRLDLNRTITASFCQLAKDKPETTYDSIVRDFGERYVPGYKAPSWADLVDAGPFKE